MTPRSVLGSLLALCVFALSCQVLPRLADSRALPPVGSAPRASLEPAPPAEVAAPDAPLDEAEEIRLVRSQLEGQHTGLSPREVGNLARTIVVESRRYGLETQLVLAVMKVESSFYHRAVSPVGAMGLMQILPSTGKEMAHALDIPWRGAHTLFDPQVNVKLGIAYLNLLEDRYQSVPKALAAYNWGPGRIDSRMRRGAELPRLYVTQVMKAYEYLEANRAAAS